MPVPDAPVADLALPRDLVEVVKSMPSRFEKLCQKYNLRRSRKVKATSSKAKRKRLRDENRCINGPTRAESPKQHGAVVKAGKCKPCCDVHEKTRDAWRVKRREAKKAKLQLVAVAT